MFDNPSFLVVAVGCGIVALILALGISQMGKGGLEGAKRSNKLMQARIIAQLVVVLIVVALVGLGGLGK